MFAIVHLREAETHGNTEQYKFIREKNLVLG